MNIVDKFLPKFIFGKYTNKVHKWFYHLCKNESNRRSKEDSSYKLAYRYYRLKEFKCKKQ